MRLHHSKYYTWCAIGILMIGLSGGGCDNSPVVPTGICATDGAHTGEIAITWDSPNTESKKAFGNSYCRVYRSESINKGYAILEDRVNGKIYYDTTVSPGQYYYYRVKGVSASGKESELSCFDQGHAGKTPYTWENQPDVFTKYGELHGKSAKEDTCWSWLGIPYAKPPVGALRWRAPMDPDFWGERDAMEYCSYCVQYGNLFSETGSETYHGKVTGKEDCLYMNIWRPKTSNILPVYVFVHGGANVLGRSDLSIYDGANFATETNMIFVSINYRLGPMGWFSHASLKTGDAFDDSGNFGTLDVLKALEFIRENISAFGGDPDNVTLTGQSAGGINTYAMMVSPFAQNLFHKAIPMSGLPLSNPKWIARHRGSMILSRLLVQDGHAVDMISAESVIQEKGDEWIAEYLRSKPVEALFPPYLSGPSGLPLDGGLGLVAVMGVYEDGVVIPNNILQCLASGSYNRVPILLGNTTDELKLFPPLVLIDPPDLEDYMATLDPDQVEFDIEEFLFPLFIPLLPLLEPLNYLGKMLFQGFAVDTTVRSLIDHQKDVYVYKFAWAEEPEPFNLIFGAAHTLDIQFVFNNFITDPGCPTRFAWSEANRESRERLSEIMRTYYQTFAKTGNPNPETHHLPVWTPWNPKKGSAKRMVFGDDDLYMSSDVMEEGEIMDVDEMMAELTTILLF